MQIDHDPTEPPRDRSGPKVYWITFIFLAVLWLITLATGSLSWGTVLLGVWTGAFVAAWAIDMTGNKTPKWMR